MSRKLLVFFIIWKMSVTVVSSQCRSDGSEECNFFPWESWSICNGNCGHQKQSRERKFCCTVAALSLENCLTHCNFHNSDRLQNLSCRVCENGGSVLSSSLCQCTKLYKGGCCQGMHELLYLYVVKLC